MTGFSVLPTDESNVDIDLINLIADSIFSDLKNMNEIFI